MTKKRIALPAVIAAALLFPFPQLVQGHTLWINMTDHSPAFSQKFGASTKTYLGFGHRYPVDDFLPPSYLAEYSLIGPGGTKKEITPAGSSGSGFLESEIRVKEPGHYVIAVTTKPGFYTMYKENDAIHHKLGPKTGLKDVVLSNYYEQYAKSLVTVGKAQGRDFDKPVGHRLEIIPLEDPATLKGDGGHTLPLQILFNGRPASFCRVYATYSGFSVNDDFAYATVADGQGIVRIRLTHWGPWLVKANLKMNPTDEMKDKCNDMNYTATLTLGIP